VRLDFSSLERQSPVAANAQSDGLGQSCGHVDEKPQHFATAADASQLAGFQVRLLGARADAPSFTVEGEHSFHMTIDRARLQDIFDQSGRPDLLMPATLDGAMVSIQIPRSVRLEYGDCPHGIGRRDERPISSMAAIAWPMLIRAAGPFSDPMRTIAIFQPNGTWNLDRNHCAVQRCGHEEVRAAGLVEDVL